MMKVLLSILITSIIITTSVIYYTPAFSTNVALADNTAPIYNATTKAIFPDPSRYFEINLPSKIAYGYDTLACVDFNKIKYISDTLGSGVIELGDIKDIQEMQIIGNYLFVLYLVKDETNTAVPALKVIDLINGLPDNALADKLKLNDYVPISISIDVATNTIYSLYGNNTIVAYEYDYVSSTTNQRLDIQDGVVYFSKNVNINDYDIKIVYNNGILYTFCQYKTNQSINYRIMSIDKNKARTEFFKLDNFTEIEVFLGYDNTIILANAIDANTQLIHCLDIANVKIHSHTTSYNGVAVKDNHILLSSQSGGAIYEYNCSNDELDTVYAYGYKGNAETMLNNPNIVSTFDNLIYINDSNNRRIIRYTLQDQKITNILSANYKKISNDENITTFAMSSTGYLIVGTDKGKVQKLNKDMVLETEYNLVDGIRIDSLTTDDDDNIYCYSSTSKTIYKMTQDGETPLISDLQDINTVHISPMASIVYLFKSNSISLYSFSEGELPLSLNLEEYSNKNIIDYHIDYNGNINILYRYNSNLYLDRYNITPVGFSLSSTTFMTHSKDMDASDSIDMSTFGKDSIILLNPKKNIIHLTTNLGFVFSQKDNIPTPGLEENDSWTTARTNSEVKLYPNPYNRINYQLMPKDSILIAYGSIAIDSIDYVLVNQNGKLGYIPQMNLTTMDNTSYAYTSGVIRHRQLIMYSIPTVDTTKIIATYNDKSIVFEIIEKTGFLNDDVYTGFVKIKLGETIGYCLASDLSIYISYKYDTTIPVYMKAKASGIGNKVPLYQTASIDSAIITTLSDGTKVMLLEEYSTDKEFIKVKIGNDEGYILSSSLYKKGLSSSQIVSIILIFGVIIASIGLYFMSRKIRTY